MSFQKKYFRHYILFAFRNKKKYRQTKVITNLICLVFEEDAVSYNIWQKMICIISHRKFWFVRLNSFWIAEKIWRPRIRKAISWKFVSDVIRTRISSWSNITNGFSWLKELGLIQKTYQSVLYVLNADNKKKCYSTTGSFLSYF